MQTITSAQARNDLSELLNKVEQGMDFVITRNGKQVAWLEPCGLAVGRKFPDMSEFRSTIKVKGEATSKLVSRMRGEG